MRSEPSPTSSPQRRSWQHASWSTKSPRPPSPRPYAGPYPPGAALAGPDYVVLIVLASDPELLDLLVRSGCQYLLLGFESSPEFFTKPLLSGEKYHLAFVWIIPTLLKSMFFR